MHIDPATFLRQVFEDFFIAGGKYEIRNFESVEQVVALAEPLIFNCTGLGAKALFGDDELTPIKGQLVFLPPDPAVNFATIGGGPTDGVRDLLYMFPRSDAIVLGGTYKMGDWSRTPETAEAARIVNGNKQIFDNFG